VLRHKLFDVDLEMTCDLRFPGICRVNVSYAITFKTLDVTDSGESVVLSKTADAAGPVELHAVRLACTQCAAAMAQTVADFIGSGESHGGIIDLNEVITMTHLKIKRGKRR
jgi:hypothetical protein